ncbi:glycoside hydrolase family 55 protein [Aspergillus clavatus NRRL 1]|uniref:Exo-beta-1,3-glucanase, putative n=1 Tax=Aspergillus clavatus (strain ATCC 1007 / CBS 513.65 / DSM 816 / NCTC 3887 / NRRL 1 / QM 1276 / 107) TaxID=344612 RepID=A1CUG6_ASPCL|nr:exo-beta-1,3-glucanase, putative [Aspergillus clavatus NRRL 1]EAW06953.1 exo-beta-1,3-glucanase, putative [Aspergillus clavatus NRRL 1]
MHINWLAVSLWLYAGVGAQSFSSAVRNHAATPSSSSRLIRASPTASVAVESPRVSVHSPNLAAADAPYWLADIAHQGVAAFNPNPATYKVFRNVKDYGAKGDGVTDDTAAINAAMSDGGRFSPAGRKTSTTTPAIIYFPAGTYLISSSIIDYYFTQIVGNPNSLPVIKATPGFTGLGLIDGDQYQNDGGQGWISTNVFFRQIRNLVLDMTTIPAGTAATGIHWPTGQASSIQNVRILMSSGAGTQHQGIFIENGSGGFATDITTVGGLYGFNIGNQQFTMRNLHISDAVVGISQIWNWGWTYQGVTITNCKTAFSISNGGPGNQLVGSAIMLDSTIENCPVFVDTAWQSSSSSNGSLILENVALNNVPVAVKGPSGTVLGGSGGSMTIGAWGQGHKYTPSGPANFQGAINAPQRPAALLASGSSRYYTKSKPQYEGSSTSSFLSVRSAGARGDGSSDDTAAIQSALNSAVSSGRIVFFDQGVYKVTDTLYIPPGSRIVGEAYPVIMASGGRFSNINQPVPVVQVGRSGESGSIEWSDMILSTQGSTPGAVLVEWNLAASPGSGMWDVHTRIGGFAGSSLQVPQCPTSAAVSAACQAAYMSMHITKSASGVYLENVWLWTADHDLDDGADTRISVYTGRGLLVEGQNIWLYGTGVEHHSLYQYQFSGSKSVVTSFIQTETPYYQPIPNAANSPYPRNPSLKDPDYSSCLPGNCNSLGLRVLDSENTIIYGAGLYSFFNHYSTTCSNFPSPEDCQSEIFSIEGSTSGLVVYALSTVGTTNMIVKDGVSLAHYSDNLATFADTISYFTL